MRAHYLQHVAFEGLGSIKSWLDARHYEITSTQFFEKPQLPDIAMIDFLIILGGPMSVNDYLEYPWLQEEKRFIQNYIKSKKPLLGICLGAQLIASAMGSDVYKNSHSEIGWFTIHGEKHNNSSLFQLPPSTTVFHWHGDTFDLPDKGSLLASSTGCTNQAFQVGTSIIGLQFHLEATPQSVADIVTHCRAELTKDTFVQSENDIITNGPEYYSGINRLMDEILLFLTGNP